MMCVAFRLIFVFLLIMFLGGCQSSAPAAYFEKGSHDGRQGTCSIIVDATRSNDIRVVEYTYEIFKNNVVSQGRRGSMITVSSGNKNRIRFPFFLENDDSSKNDLSILGKVFYFPINPFEKTLYENGLYRPSLDFSGSLSHVGIQ